MLPLQETRVLDVSTGIAGGYCTKLLANAGATVVKIEPSSGDPLRTWSASNAPTDPKLGGALFQYLHAGKASVVLDLDDRDGVDRLRRFAAAADIVLEAEQDHITAEELQRINPAATIVSISPWGRKGPWADRPATEFTLQAQSGSMARRGDPTLPPVAVGGRVGDWATGMFAALSAIASRELTRQTGVGEHLDVSTFECIAYNHMLWPGVSQPTIPGDPSRLSRYVLFPSVLPCKDGVVGITTLTGQHWEDFCAMVGHPEWLEEESLYLVRGRAARHAELAPAAAEWSAAMTVNEVIDVAVAFRIPVTPIANGENLPRLDHYRARKSFVENPGGFLQPASPLAVCGIRERDVEPSPALGAGGSETLDGWNARTTERREAQGGTSDGGSLFAGIRIADFTQFFGASIVGQILASLGAEVIHIESTRRMDGFRSLYPARPIGEPLWWETSIPFFWPNAGKRNMTLDLQRPEGAALAKRLVATCDVVLDGYTPRVLEQLGLDYDVLRALRSDLIMMRMPAFGVFGPWRDRSGFGPTIDHATGLSWITGYPGDLPLVTPNVCDPIAGGHATIALLLALLHRRQSGAGQLIEAPMTDGALSITAEQVIEFSAYGSLLERDGNRTRGAAPQGLYRAADVEEYWVAISVETDLQWAGLVSAIGDPGWAKDPCLRTLEGRRDAHDMIDKHLESWCRERRGADAVATLSAAGVPVAETALNMECDSPQMQARRFVETIDHPVVGRYRTLGWPVRHSARARPWNRGPAPRLGQDNHQILHDLGLSADEIEALRRDGVIGDAPSA